MEHFRVLIVDDSLVIRSLLTDVLSGDREVTIVAAVASAEAATAVLDEHQVDVVTLDVEMPGISGLEYLPTLSRFNIPVVLLSGHAVEGSDLRGSALMLGADACFNKARAVSDGAKLIELVKSVARRQVSIGKADARSLARVQNAAKKAADELGVRADWHILTQ